MTSGQKGLGVVELLLNLEGRMGFCQGESHTKETVEGSMASEIVSDHWSVAVLNMAREGRRARLSSLCRKFAYHLC